MTDTPSSAPRLALVTGASRGLGAAMAEALAPEHHVVAVARTVGALEELDDRIQARSGQATLAPLDVTDDGAMQHLCRSIFERWGGVDLWVHTAIHAAPLTPTPMIDGKDWERSWQTNVEATRRLIAYVAPLLVARQQAGGTARALFFDDSRAGAAYFGSYGATKAAQVALVRSWAAETVRTGPEVRLLAPRPMPTAVRARFHPGEDRAPLAAPADEAARLLAGL
ncbi:SDR family NAD(P)-dependent oxidoreductase [Rhodovulum sp. 12E13]|uniref:SDR family NAD(P)-dependent oxidoreductase n=1 Tax=Rhodovulum sp. 12E13 TaxID=2203891 RepID=UPI000E155CDB|nr:SDR family oxidoreductase [Rhodovulum sp. 12E13]RDC71673.1 SDR family NAD(P)-dependent oxidoreductase [Rhodovulum sp. 12E13]